MWLNCLAFCSSSAPRKLIHIVRDYQLCRTFAAWRGRWRLQWQRICDAWCCRRFTLRTHVMSRSWGSISQASSPKSPMLTAFPSRYVTTICIVCCRVKVAEFQRLLHDVTSASQLLMVLNLFLKSFVAHQSGALEATGRLSILHIGHGCHASLAQALIVHAVMTAGCCGAA